MRPRVGGTGPAQAESEAGHASWLRSPGLATAVYTVVLAVSLAFHDPWRDELQSWEIARASASLTQLIHNIRYEGHPVLWFAVLWPVARFTGSPEALLFVAFVIAVTAAWLVLSKAPFPWWVRVAFVFSYFPLFEYGTIARSYGLGMLLTIAACITLADQRRDRLLTPLLLGALALTSVYDLFISGALFCWWMVDAWLRARESGTSLVTRARVAGAALYASCVVVAVAEIIPPANAPFGGNLSTPAAGRTGLTVFWEAMVPLPAHIGERFWGSNVYQTVPGGRLFAAAAGVILVLLVLIVVRRSPASTVLWLSGIAVWEVFAVFFYQGDVHHGGTIVLLALAACWLARSSTPSWPTSWRIPLGPARVSAAVKWLERVAPAALVACLVASVAAGLIAVANDVSSPFSPAATVAAELRRAGLSKAFIVGTNDALASGVAGELDRPIWYAGSNRYGTFVRWDRARHPVRRSQVPGIVASLRSRVAGPLVVLSDSPLAAMPGTRLLAAHPDSISREAMWVYVVGVS